jgi:hypothetical protein
VVHLSSTPPKFAREAWVLPDAAALLGPRSDRAQYRYGDRLSFLLAAEEIVLAFCCISSGEQLDISQSLAPMRSERP